MATKLGIGLPNGNPFTQDSFGALMALGPLGAFTVLHEDADRWVPAILQHYHDNGGYHPLVTIRFYHADVMHDSPEDRARGHAEWAQQRVLGASAATIWPAARLQFTPANELNLAGEHPEEPDFVWDSWQGYRRINDWLVRWHNEFKRLCPWAITQFPAFSPGHGEDGIWVDGIRVGTWSGMEECREAISLFDTYGQHSYWPLGEWGSHWYGRRYIMHREELVRLGLGTKPMMITEFNCEKIRSRYMGDLIYAHDITLWLAPIEDDPLIQGTTHFIWDSTDERFYELTLYPGMGQDRAYLADYVASRQETSMSEDILLRDTELFQDPIVGRDFDAFEEWWTTGGRLHYLRHRQAQGYEPIGEVGIYLTELDADASALISQAYTVGQQHPKA